MKSKERNRSRNIDDLLTETILEILDGWPNQKLTWNSFTIQILKKTNIHYTRQTLNNHPRIKQAFSNKKKIIAEQGFDRAKTQSYEHQRISRLEAEIARLTMENNNLLEQFNRWAYNGFLKQMDKSMLDFLNNPLPPINREPSKIKLLR